MAKRPFSQATIDHVLPKITNDQLIDDLVDELAVLFKVCLFIYLFFFRICWDNNDSIACALVSRRTHPLLPAFLTSRWRSCAGRCVLFSHSHTHARSNTWARAHTHTHTHTRTHARTHTHARAHTPSFSPPPPLLFSSRLSCLSVCLHHSLFFSNRQVLHGHGWPANAIFFHNRIREKPFFSAGCLRKRDRAKRVRWGGKEIRFNLFGALYFKLFVPTCFAISGYPLQWANTKWRWLATQDHAKLVYLALQCV